ncbi:hemagglutinin/amebocyte aggregation factor-like [Anomaloglossus baeobatrachus]
MANLRIGSSTENSSKNAPMSIQEVLTAIKVTVTPINSVHDNKAEDRVWGFGCQNTFYNPGSCFWTGYVNEFDQEFTFTCPFGLVLSLMHSYHNNDKEDRRWRFLCCNGETAVQSNCRWSGYVNDFDNYLRWDAPPNYHLVGAHSYHDNNKEDRRWNYYSCEKNYYMWQ